MKKSMIILIGVFILLLVGCIFIVYQALKPRPPAKTSNTVVKNVIIPEADSSLVLQVVKSSKEDNSVDISVKGLRDITGLEYELSYETQGQIQGVNNGNKPLDVTGKETFERTIYLGTQSSGKKTPHKGVTEVQVTMRFTNSSGQKTQRSASFPL